VFYIPLQDLQGIRAVFVNFPALWDGCGMGTIFRATTNGAIKILASFNNTNGPSPQPSGLIQASDGTFYGSIYFGGITNLTQPFGCGQIFQVTTNGILTMLFSFNTTNGANPNSLTLGNDGTFYGITGAGGVGFLDQSGGDGTIFSLSLAPAIISQPTSQTNSAGETVTFSISATNLMGFGYQWQRSSTNILNGGNVSGANTCVLTITNISDSDAVDYSVIVTNALGSLGSVTSSIVTLTVLDPPIINIQPQPLTVTIGHAANFEVVAAGAKYLDYQWFFNGTNLIGETNTLLAIQNAFPTNAGVYTVVITNAYGSVTSYPAMLAVLPLDIGAATQLTNGQFQFSFDTAPGVYYAVQYSTNLTQWFPLVKIGGNGVPLNLIDPDTTGNRQRFYRVILSPQ